jgi:hypothetical protein
LRDAAILVKGSGQDPFVYLLREKVFDKMKELKGKPDRCLGEARVLGETMGLL